jgi:hypothetical protein
MFARLLLVALVLVAGCEKTDHESIDKWPRTEKGPGKLKKAFEDESLDPDLSAHAGVNMIRPPLSQETEVRGAIERMSPGRRTAVIEKMLPRLWEIARVENEKKPATTAQVAGKDALFTLRRFADDNQKKTIDGYMVDWYGVYAYEARANAGQYAGPQVIRAVGPSITKKLIEVINGFIAAPGQEKSKYRIGDELMLAIAVSNHPDGVKKLLEVAKMDRGDDTLATRAVDALYKAYVNPQSLFDILPPDALVPNLDALVAFAKDDTQKGKVTNDLIELIRAVGTPKCFTALVGMIGSPHRQSRFKYVAANNALRCGGVKGIVEVVKALPETGAYVQAELTGAISGEIAKMSPRAQVLEAFRQLLSEKSVIARWVAIEGLAAMKSVEDQPRIAALSGAKEVLTGYWGDNAEGKKDPTLGARAKELADQMGKPN